ncbi:hypothetical protein KCV07_g6204, partial [Aureobasidium melanogenum]
MAMRNCKTVLLHVAYIAGAIWIGAHELALHNITDSDVYKGPTESPVAYPLNPPVVPSVEPLQPSTSTPTIFDASTVTTTEYITVTRDNDPTPLPYIHRGLSSRNPYANSSFVLGAIPYVVPFFKSSYGQAFTHILSSISSHPVTKAICQATASLISFLLYLWSILPGGKQGLNTLALALLLYALQFAYFWDPLARWFSRLFRRRNNKSPPSRGSGPSPPLSPPSSGRPGGDDNDSPPGSPKPLKDTSSAGAQTTPRDTRSIETQTTGLVTEGERNCLNKVARLQGQLTRLQNELAQVKARAEITISDRDKTIEEYEDNVSTLQNQRTQDGHTLRYRQAQIRQLRDERESIAENHGTEIDRLQAQIDAAASNVETENDEIKRLKEAHEAQVKELQTNHDTTVQNLESEAQRLQTENDGLRYNNERLQNENNALNQQSESSSGTADNASSIEERQRFEGQIRDLQEDVQSLTAALQRQQKEHALEVDRAVARACSQAWTDLEMTKRRLEQSHETVSGLQRQLKKAQGLFAPPTPQVVALRNEVAALKEALSQKEAEDAAVGEQKKPSVEAQNEQERALADCNSKVEALQSTNTALTQRNQALLEQERAAKQAEEKAKTDAEALQRQVDSLARAGDEAAAGLQQGIADAKKREEALRARVNELQQGLSQAEAVRDTAVRQQQEDAATAQRLREFEEQLNGRISSLEQDLLQARNAHAADVRQQQQDNKAQDELTTALQVANNENIRLQRELSEVQEKNQSMLEQGQEMLKQGQELEAVRNELANLNQTYKNEGEALYSAHESLKQAYEEQAQRCAAEKSASEARAKKLLQHEKQNSDSLRQIVRELKDEVTKLEDQNSEMRSDDQQREGTNRTTQPTPFTNPPTFPPPHTGASPIASPLPSPGGRKIAPLRKKSPKRDTTGESKDPAQEILDWCNDISADNTTSTSTRPIVTDFTNGALGNAPVLQPNHNFATGAAGHAQNSAAPGTPLDPALGGTAPRAAPGAASTPLRTRDQEREEHNAREREARQQRQHEERKEESKRVYSEILGVTSDRQHQEMLEEGRRRHEEALQNQREYDLANYEDDDSMDASGAADGPSGTRMDTEPTGNTSADTEMSSYPHGVPNSEQEIAFLRTLPGNDNSAGIYDELYRRHNYQLPDGFDEFDGPLFRNELVVGDPNEIFFLRNMVGNADGRYDALYRGNNYRMPDDWDEFDNPVWY